MTLERGSPAWRYFGDFRTGLLAAQVLTLQVAHPVVAAGVRDHSDYVANPWTRLMRTGASLSIYVYGGAEGAAYEAGRLRALHREFTGVRDDGRRYSGLDPHAYAWVHATLVRLAVDAQEFFGRPIPAAELEEYYAQMTEVGRLLGIGDRYLPGSWGEFCRYYDEMVASFGPNGTIDELVETIGTVRPPFPVPFWSSLRGLQLFLLSATLPPAFRDRLGLQWTDAQQRRFDRLRTVVRTLAAPVPASLRNAHFRFLAWLNIWYRARHAPAD
ncbi:oxygenase MpaB family protein [Amycolatopsis sp.]|uniref:oxygenase MpaB family protein n=1 Tax=Amycolatopsis sp. TaxID=37632 RepID=UPI002CBB2C6E|nr:oxygenase MpaB family protein [Amycolatopsis sp.]HVV14092.1 oxygenase MpaB family protein [Amycolatopsis sp.]